jgi:BTB/POZ domain-containing protein 9
MDSAKSVSNLLSYFLMRITCFRDEQESHRILLECVRLPLIKIEDLLGIVRPTNLVDADRILDTINEQTNKRNKFLNYRGTKLLNTNICTQQNARVIEGEYTEHLLRTDSMRVEIERCPRHALTENYKKGITIELGMAYIINYIELHLFDRDQRAYSYFVEVSTDQHDWIRVIDYTNYLCRSRQQLYFSQKVVKFIRIVGTFAKVNNSFYLTTIKAMFTNKPFNVDPDTTLLRTLITSHSSIYSLISLCLGPTQNIASIENGAIVVEGVSRSRNALINGNCEEYDWDVGYTCHQIGSGSITVQLPQPYLINSMRLLLWDCDDRSYSFDIDVSSDGQAWTQVVKAHELRLV